MKKKVLSLTIVFALLTGLINIAAVADENPPTQVTGTPNCQVLATMDARYAEQELTDYLFDNGIYVQPGDEIVAVSIEDGTKDGLMGLQVNREEGAYCVSDSLIIMNDEGEQIDAPIAVSSPLSRSSTNITWVPNSITGGGPITVNVTAYYSLEVIGNFPNERYFVDPAGFTYRYTKNRNCDVEILNMAMDFSGRQCNSNYEVICDPYEVRLGTKNVANPVEGTSYTCTVSYSNLFKLEYLQGTGGVAASQLYIVMDTIIDDNWDNTTRPLILPEY